MVAGELWVWVLPNKIGSKKLNESLYEQCTTINVVFILE